MSTFVAVALATLAAAVAGLLACVVMYLRRLDADIQRLNDRYGPSTVKPLPTIRIPMPPPAVRPPMRGSWTSER